MATKNSLERNLYMKKMSEAKSLPKKHFKYFLPERAIVQADP